MSRRLDRWLIEEREPRSANIFHALLVQDVPPRPSVGVNRGPGGASSVSLVQVRRKEAPVLNRQIERVP